MCCRRRTKLQFYKIIDISSSSFSPLAPDLTPCLVSTVDFGAQILASAANYHFPGEAAAVAPSADSSHNKLWIWDIERGAVDSYLRAFDADDHAGAWAECIWGHHPRSIFCFGQRCMKTVDLRSAAVSSAIEIGGASALPSGRFHGAHSPRDSRVPMIVTTSSSALSLWDLRFLREPSAQIMHHLEHEPPSIISSCVRGIDCGSSPYNSLNDCLYMDVLACSSRFGYPLLHSVKVGDESTPVSVSLPQSVYGLRAAHQQQNSSSALHPDGAHSAAAVTSGMCLLSTSLPPGVRTVAFFASLNGNIWVSCVSDKADTHESPASTSRQRYPIATRSSAVRKTDTARTMAERAQIDPTHFRSWMALPRTPPLVDVLVLF